jgi:hypothetical protein
LPRRVEFRGKSGASYAYIPIDEANPFRSAGANVVIASQGSDGWLLHYAGETDDLRQCGWRPALERVRQEHPHAQCFVRLNVGSATRRAERDDLIAEHDPIFNQGGG